VALNNTNPSGTVDSQNAKFAISIRQIIEKDKNLVEIRPVTISTVKFTKVDSSSGLNTISNYTAVLEFGAILTFLVSPLFFIYNYLLFVYFLFKHSFTTQKVYQFEEPSTPFSFAGETMTFPKDTLKFTVSVQNWPFQSLSNSLFIVFDSNSQPQSSVCSQTSPGDSVQWILVFVNNVALYLYL
jgi:hypothetical protein